MKEYHLSLRRDGDADAVASATPERLEAVERLVSEFCGALRATGAAAIVLSGLQPTADVAVPPGREAVVAQSRLAGPSHYILTMLGDALSAELISIGRAYGVERALGCYAQLGPAVWNVVQQQLASDGRTETP